MLAGTPQPSLAARPHARECTKEPAGQTALSQHVLFAAGIPGQRVCPEPRGCLPCRDAGHPGPRAAGRFGWSPRGKRRPRVLRGCRSLPRGVRGAQRARGFPLRPLIAPGRSVGAAASRASPAPSPCWRWATGSRRHGGTAPAPPPGRDGPRCWRGSPGWTRRCSDRRRTLAEGGTGTR